jgi:imidazolonepropionase-like amidohydrolase
MFQKSWLVMGAAAFLLAQGTPVRLAAQQQGVVVVDGGTLIDGTGAAPVSDSVVVLENGKVTAAGSRAAVRAPAGARVIDAKGKYVIPGLVDGHVHYRTWNGELYLNNGVTTVIDLSNPTDWIIAVRDAAAAGKLQGPRIFTSGLAITRRPTAPGGAAWARREVMARLDKKTDVIKITADLTQEEYQVITGEAHKRNLVVLGHSTDVYASVNGGMDGITHLWGVSATLMTPENKKKWQDNNLLSPYAWAQVDKMDDLVAFMVQHHTALGPHIVNEHSGVLRQARQYELEDYQMVMNPELRYVPLSNVLNWLTFWHKVRSYSSAVGTYPYVETADAAVMEESRRGLRNAMEFLRRFNKAGGLILAGTDSGGSANVPGASLHKEIEQFVDAGLTPMQALVTATRLPAEFFHVDDKVGTIRPGRFADVLILDANPLSDIHNTTKIRTIIKGGEVLDGRYHRDYHSDFAEVEEPPISSSAPVPVVAAVGSKGSVVHGTAFDLVVTGRDFHSTSLVSVNGKPVPTSFVSDSELRARVPGDRIPAAGNATITVFTPWPGGGTSSKALTVN